MFNLPAHRASVYEASGLGAAIVGAGGCRLHADFGRAVKAMTHPGRSFEPDAGRAAVYDALYRRVYLRMYRRLEPLYAELHRLRTALAAGRRD